MARLAAGAGAKRVEAVDFPIVGLGASAGGLEAFEQFFRHVPPDSGMAFVVVQHLDPDHASILAEILQRATAMPVVETADQMPVEADHVYVIPPNRDIAIFHGTLQLSKPGQARGHRMPIDAFMRSLAEDRGEGAIGIILSGTGTDGTLGLRAILGAGGIALVQAPATARYDGMPASAIRAGYATQVLPVERMAEALQSARRSPHPQATMPAVEAATGMRHILMQLRTATGHDFSQYKKSTINRRIERRMALNGLDDVEVYARHLKDNPEEVKSLFRELLINVTSFFRDPEAFATLKRDVLPHLCDDKPDGAAVRVWVAGGATGEEAYSIAMLLREFMEETRRSFTAQIYSTDLDDEAIATARTGVYPPNIVQDLSPERLHRHFLKEDGGYRVKKEIREMVVFAVQNAIKDPPFTRMDLVSCRNLMIYLEPELQARLLPALHYALRPGGVLFLSPSESIGSHSDLFVPISRKWKLYRTIQSPASARTVMASGVSWAVVGKGKTLEDPVKNAQPPDFGDMVRRELVKSFAPASVVTDLKGNILYVHGETGGYLRPAPGQASLNVIDMAREGLNQELQTAITFSAAQGQPTLGRKVTIGGDGPARTVSIDVRPMVVPEPNSGLLLVSFQDVPHADAGNLKRSKRSATPKGPGRDEELERELTYTRESLQATIEEQQAANEEMQSTNEELQSTNEELETSKEELQSVNEELVTVNAELQAKIEQLIDVQNDMKNLFDNINVGTIFLDEHLVIRRFSREAVRIYPMVASDVGRPLADIKPNLASDEDILPKAQAVLDTLAPQEIELRTADGGWYLARIQPYRTIDNVIEGVVLTFTDITQRVAAEAAVQQARKLAESIVDMVGAPLLVLDEDLKIVSASRPFYRQFQVSPQETLGRPIRELGNRQWDIPVLNKMLEGILHRDQSFEGLSVEHVFPGIGHKILTLSARRIAGESISNRLILLSFSDST